MTVSIPEIWTNGGEVPLPSARAPLAIVGIGCRFPGGGNGPEQFWQNLSEGVDAITDVPHDRWNPEIYFDPHPGTPGRSSAARGGFIEGIDQFDPEFFGISRREAMNIDPQHRLLLEVAWETFEDAGATLAQVKGSRCGVFVGLSNLEYGNLDGSPAGLLRSDAYSNTGAAMSLAANRISYSFDLHGPSFVVDTACSSALIAVHSACQSLWDGECTTALAGGVNALLRPHAWVGMSRLAMLSPDAQCKAFDASANGFVRSEGAGLVYLKPLAAAVRDRDRIYAVIRGTASNQDGHTTGITVPSERAQADLVRAACERAGIPPHAVDYIEAHGTGTLIGDPIECRALGSVLGAQRAVDDPLWIGSVKSNIGHLESAAGIAGLIKASLAVYHRQIPANLHFHTPNPEIPFDDLRLRVPQALTAWPQRGSSAIAAVNSFGFGGSNAHVILSGAPTQADGMPAQNGHARTTAGIVAVPVPRLLPLSARSAEALKQHARQLAAEFHRGADWDDVGYTLAQRRTHHSHRCAVVARTATEAATLLQNFADGAASAKLIQGRVADENGPPIVFVFSGQGTQYCGMVRDLLLHEPVFRLTMEECDRLLSRYADWSLLAELAKDAASSRLDQTAIAQPAIFAVQVALARLWRSWGIIPSAVVGHSVGEVAAAHVSGILSLDEAVRIIYHRGRCMDVPEARGRMLAVGLPQDQVQTLIAGREHEISLAAINSPSTMTLSGSPAVLQSVATKLEQRSVFHTFLNVEYAFHSPCIDGQEQEFLRSITDLQLGEETIPFYSGVRGERVTGTMLTPAYWWDSVRQTVQFSQAVTALLNDGFNTFVELAAHGVLLGPVMEIADHHGTKISMVHALRRDADQRESLLKCAGSLFVNGAALRWDVLSPAGLVQSLPNYPWQHERFWNETEAAQELRLGRHYHRLLGHRIPAGFPLWENQFDLRVQRYFADHCVQGHPVVPAAAYLEMASRAARDLLDTAACILDDVHIHKACFLRHEQTVSMQLVVNAAEASFRIMSRPLGTDQDWTEHVTGRFRPAARSIDPALCDLEALKQRLPRAISAAECYRRFQELGIDYGPSFQCLDEVHAGTGEALATIHTPPALQPFRNGYHLHPALLDACFQSVICLAPHETDAAATARVYLPVEFQQMRVVAPTPDALCAHARLVERDSRTIVADISIYDQQGRMVTEIVGLRCHAVESLSGEKAVDVNDWVFEYRWKPQALAVRSSSASPSTTRLRLDEVTAEVRQRYSRQFAGMATDQRVLDVCRRLTPLCIEWILRAWAELGLEVRPGARFVTDELAPQLHVLPRHTRLMNRYVQVLEANGAIRPVGKEYEFVRGIDPDFMSHSRPLWWQNPDSYPDVSLLHRMGEQLGAVLAGTVEPLELLFPNGNMALAEWYYQDSPSLRFTNTRLQMAVGAMARQWPVGRPLRILEVGAGTGAFTSYVLPELVRCPCEVRYTYTDLSDAFLTKARERFRDFPFVQYAKFDLEQDPRTQGYEANSFDLIVASQVLHATSDLEVTLQHLRRVLSPDGVLAFVEFVNEEPFPMVDVVFGVLEGWWRFRDLERRPDYPTMNRSQWNQVLSECGFTSITEAAGDFAGQAPSAVLMAQVQAAAAQSDIIPLETAPAIIPATNSSSAAGRWLLFCDRGGLGRKLAATLRARGECVQTVMPGTVNRPVDDSSREWIPADEPGLRQLLTDVCRPGQPELTGVVNFWACDADLNRDDLLDTVDAGRSPFCMAAVQILKGLAERIVSTPPRVWLITRGAQTVADLPAVPQPLQAALWGLGRVAMNELRTLRPTLLDVSPEPTDTELDGLAAELLANVHEEEVALRSGSRYVHRLIRTAGSRPAPRSVSADEMSFRPRFRLETSRQGTLDQLVLRGQPPTELPPGAVEVAVHASALNFSDVMKALGLYPGLPDGPVSLGLEFAGRITRVGTDVASCQVGDAVLGLAPFSFASDVIADARYIVKMPAGMTFEEAATLPVAYLTAYYALHSLGRIRRGERVLIHAATGGVGLAAIQLAQLAGAEIFATAGTPEKRDFLRWLGVPHVMDSRSLFFADEVLAATHGEGVDLVLNSLSGQAIQKSLSLLRDYGRFLEIGKRDIYADSRLGMRPFRRNLSFHAIDLDGAMRQRPEMVSDVFQELAGLIQQQRVSVIPYRVFRLSNIGAAFRYMAQARHIGKVVVTHCEPDVDVLAATKTPYRYRHDATYLITGGLGGVGLAMAEGMVRSGARQIVMMQRSGPTPEAEATLETLRAAGADIRIERADITQPEDLTAVLDRIAESQSPLAGVLHLAMVLEDSLIATLDAERFERVWSPKVRGAWNLHLQTQSLPLDFFVCFSSVSSLVGIEGQANYAAANAFLDGLAAFRRAQNLPALTINWGYLGEVGWVARHKDVAQKFESLGMQGIRPHEVLALLGRFINDGSIQVGVVGSGANEFVRLVAGQSPRFEDLSAEDADGRGKKRDLGGGRAALMAVAPEQRRDLLESLLCDQVARVLGTTSDRLDTSRPLTDLGLDSLVAVELKNWTEAELGLQLPTMELLRGPSVSQLADLLCRQVDGDVAPPASAPTVNVDELTDEQVDAMLASLETAPAAAN